MKTKTKKVPYGPNIVRAWFDTVIQYALRGLESERGCLSKRNWTFRFQDQALEYLRPLRERLPADALPNLEQFVSFFPSIDRQIAEHDMVERSGERLLIAADELTDGLKEKRSELSLEFDVPVVAELRGAG